MKIVKIGLIAAMLISVGSVCAQADITGSPEEVKKAFYQGKKEEVEQKENVRGRFFGWIKSWVIRGEPVESVAPTPEMKEPGEGLKRSRKTE